MLGHIREADMGGAWCDYMAVPSRSFSSSPSLRISVRKLSSCATIASLMELAAEAVSKFTAWNFTWLSGADIEYPRAQSAQETPQ